MDQKSKIIEIIKIVGSKLQDQEVTWLVGGSGSLLIHGLDVTPNDIDIIVNPEDFNEVQTILKDFQITDTFQTQFRINDIEVELIPRRIDSSLLENKRMDRIDVFVYKLSVEYSFYRARTDKIEANRIKIDLIEKELDRQNNL